MAKNSKPREAPVLQDVSKRGENMPYIPVPDNMPGIVGLFAFRPETAKPLTELGEVLLRSPNSLSPGERELIASYVSSRNGCFF